jgi:hypothetical protein
MYLNEARIPRFNSTLRVTRNRRKLRFVARSRPSARKKSQLEAAGIRNR